MPKVSVIIPAYNAERFIKNAVESVLVQTFRDFEVFVIDDGSTDNTLKIIREYEPRIKVFTKTNGGPASARNVGIQNSSAEYISFLDADDLWPKDTLKLQTEFMEKNHQFGFAYGDSEFFYPERHDEKTHLYTSDFEGHVFKHLFWNNFISNSTVIVRKKCFDKVGLLDESKELLGAEDFDLWLRLNMHFPVGHIPQVLSRKRIHSGSLVGNSYEKAFPLHLNVYKKFFRIFPKIQYTVGSQRNEYIGDLCMRYAYNNFIEKKFIQAYKKLILALFYTPIKAVTGFYLVMTKNYYYDRWANMILDFDQWHKIITHKW